MKTTDPTPTRADCQHCAERVPLDSDGIMHTHDGSDGWHERGHVSPCFSVEAYGAVQARRAAREVVIVAGGPSAVDVAEALRRTGRPMKIVTVPDRLGGSLERAVENVRLQLPTIIRAGRRVNADPWRNAGYFADTRRRGRQ